MMMLNKYSAISATKRTFLSTNYSRQQLARFCANSSKNKLFFSTNVSSSFSAAAATSYSSSTSTKTNSSSSTTSSNTAVPTPVNCRLFFGPRGRPLILNQVSSVDDIKYYAAQWLGVSDYHKIRIVKLPKGENERVMQLSGAVKPESAPLTNESPVNDTLNNNDDLQVLLEIAVKIRHTMYADLPTNIYVHDVTETKDFSRALHHYGSWKHKMLLVKYVYQEGFGPEYVGSEGESVFDRVFISRDETLKSIQERGMPHKIVKLVGEGKMFELVVAPTLVRRVITTGLLALVLTLDVYIYCYVLP